MPESGARSARLQLELSESAGPVMPDDHEERSAATATGNTSVRHRHTFILCAGGCDECACVFAFVVDVAGVCVCVWGGGVHVCGSSWHWTSTKLESGQCAERKESAWTGFRTVCATGVRLDVAKSSPVFLTSRLQL